jgi:hypothetical protein
VRASASILIASLLLACACGCGRTARRSAPPKTPGAQPAAGVAFGLTEDDAQLLSNPGGRPAAEPFQAAREQLTALHPTYLRLLVDWAALQPSPSKPAALAGVVGGCARLLGPCGAYAGIAAELAAIASQQRAPGAGGGFQVVIDVFGVPAWAAQPVAGCEDPATAGFARALRPGAVADYQALIASLLALGEREGVALDWWSPWNEPNDPRFISPQRASCAQGAPPVSPASYARLATAMAAVLRAHGARHQLVLGELNAFEKDTPHTTSIGQFVAALPPELICLGGAWSVHAYALRSPPAKRDPVAALEAALDARGACGRNARIWVTEAGAGAPHPGRPRPPGSADERAGCLALARQLERWRADPRVGAVFQYTFREDPAFPVGLISPSLTHLYPAYHLWQAWSGHAQTGESASAPAAACG